MEDKPFLSLPDDTRKSKWSYEVEFRCRAMGRWIRRRGKAKGFKGFTVQSSGRKGRRRRRRRKIYNFKLYDRRLWDDNSKSVTLSQI